MLLYAFVSLVIFIMVNGEKVSFKELSIEFVLYLMVMITCVAYCKLR